MYLMRRILSLKVNRVLKLLFGVIVCVLAVSTIKILYYFFNPPVSDYPIVIWWTFGFPDTESKFPACEHKLNCEFTNKRDKKLDANVRGFLFYGSSFNYLDLPLPRQADRIIWGLLHEESPRNTPILAHDEALEMFNYSSTISRYSDVPLTLQYLENIQDLLPSKYVLTTKEKNTRLKKLAPVLYIQTDCDTSSYRDAYVKELMKHIPVDSYGDCLNNKVLPTDLKVDYLNQLYSDAFLNFVAQYKFTIAFENGICEDYITEKLWRPLKVGSVPIYMGSPSVRDWLPNKESAIVAQEFNSPKQLAAYVHYLNNNDDAYELHLQHVLSSHITNMNLINTLKERKWSNFGYYLANDDFECFICAKIYEKLFNESYIGGTVNRSHYNCLEPSPPFPDPNFNNDWLSTWQLAKKTAKNVNHLVMKSEKSNFTEDEVQ